MESYYEPRLKNLEVRLLECVRIIKVISHGKLGLLKAGFEPTTLLKLIEESLPPLGHPVYISQVILQTRSLRVQAFQSEPKPTPSPNFIPRFTISFHSSNPPPWGFSKL